MPLQSPQDFGKLIRETRKANKVTQKELAAACGTGIRFIRELEKGKASCELGKALLAATMLGIKLKAILPFETGQGSGFGAGSGDGAGFGDGSGNG
jgi:y4mF family transcriptional regulator